MRPVTRPVPRARGVWALAVAVAAVGLVGSAPAAAVPLQVTSGEAPIERVVVFSTQARVYRAARVAVGPGVTRTILATLPTAVRPDTVRVECDSATIVNVEVTRTWERLPRQAEAKALTAKLEALLGEIRALDDERRVLQAELQAIDSLRPLAQRLNPDKQPPALFVDTWRRVLQWADGRTTKLRTRLGTFPRRRYPLEQRLQALQVEARKLLPDSAPGPALRVAVSLKGTTGAHRVVLSYLVGGVRWVPSYDLRYDPRNPAVEASYYALVSQSSGEDWVGARLSFSTIMPTHLLAVPELPTWTFGKTTSFTPTPRLRWEPHPGTWHPPTPRPRPDRTLRILRETVGRATPVTGATGGEAAAPEEDKAEIPKAEDRRAQGYRRRTAVKLDDESVDGALARPTMPSPAPSAAPDMEPPPAPRRMRALSESVAVSGGRRRVRVSTPTETLPWTDAGYRPPYVNPDLPAASAKGYRFTMDAPGRHKVVANGTPVRIPLLRERFTVNPIYKIVPGRSKNAYLTAEVYNSTGRPILRGQANLFSGATYSGQTKLATAVPGAKVLLPLGVDEGVKVSRIINQRTVSTGIVFKDDVSEYTVSIEIANHRRHPIQVEVVDQIPVKANDDTKIEGFEANPAMTGPELNGRITWKGRVGAAKVQKLIFKFRIVRPKNWELRQING